MKGRVASTVFVAALIFFAGYAALFIAPDEKTMHAIQRIFYFHLPSWIAMFTALSVVFVANIAYLATRKAKWDALGVAGAEAGVVCCTIGLATGPLWARPVWGIWWTWDARLTSAFILWLLYISYLLTRKMAPSGQVGTLSAVLAIFAAIDVPIVFESIRWWRTQHPAPVFTDGGSVDPSLYPAILWNMAGWLMWGIFILAFRFLIERRRQLAEQENALRTIEASLDTL